MAKLTPQMCVYCENPADTWDHVPPRTILRVGEGETHPKVPCCSKCNGAFSADDEVVRDFLTSEIRNERHDLVKEKFADARNRAWEKFPGKRDRILDQSRIVQVGDSDLLPAFDMETPVFRRFLRRMMIAVIYLEHAIRVQVDSIGWDTRESWAAQGLPNPDNLCRSGALRSFASEAFQYRLGYKLEEQQAFLWMRFFAGTEMYIWWSPIYNLNDEH